MTTTLHVVKGIRAGRFLLDVAAAGHHLRAMSDKQTLTMPEVAKLCGVDPNSIRNWIRRGKGPRHTRTPGGMTIFRVESVALWMAENDFRVPDDLRQHLQEPHRTKEELLAAVEDAEHVDRVALLAEYRRWLAVRSA